MARWLWCFRWIIGWSLELYATAPTGKRWAVKESGAYEVGLNIGWIHEACKDLGSGWKRLFSGDSTHFEVQETTSQHTHACT